MSEETLGREGKPSPGHGVGWKKCTGIKKSGEPCSAWVSPGRSLCMAHERKARLDVSKALASSKVAAPLSPDEGEEFQGFLDKLTKQVKPRGPADEVAIHRLAMAIVRAHRLDAQARGGNPSAVRALYFTDLTIQNWLVKLGVDRRLRVKKEDEESRRVKAMGRASHLWKGNGSDGGPQPLNLERPEVDEDGNEIEVPNRKAAGAGEPPDPPEPGEKAPAGSRRDPAAGRIPPQTPAARPGGPPVDRPASGRPVGRVRETGSSGAVEP